MLFVIGLIGKYYIQSQGKLKLIDEEEPQLVQKQELTSSSQLNLSSKNETIDKSVNAALININQANREKLISLKGVGPGLADKILQFREENGAFRSAEDLLKVKGIGKKKLKTLKTQIKF